VQTAAASAQNQIGVQGRAVKNLPASQWVLVMVVVVVRR